MHNVHGDLSVHGVLSDHSLCTVFTPSDDHLEHTLHSVCVLCNLYTDLVVFGAPGDHHSHGVHGGQ